MHGIYEDPSHVGKNDKQLNRPSRPAEEREPICIYDSGPEDISGYLVLEGMIKAMAPKPHDLDPGTDSPLPQFPPPIAVQLSRDPHRGVIGLDDGNWTLNRK